MSDRATKLLIFVLSIGFFWGSLLSFPAIARADGFSAQHIEEINSLWQKSAHAFADINCSSCHLEAETKQLIIAPKFESCQTCHERQVETFLFGKHGVRSLEGLSPLTPAMAHLPMKETASDRQMNCNTCHDVHSVDTFTASVDSCLSCHNDTHSLNYVKSKHGLLFAEAKLLPAPTADLVSCATCHLPRQQVEGTKTVFVNHNNTYNLLPRDRMVKDVCMNCHGLEYSYNSIFDDELVEANFNAPPTQYLETFDMVKDLEKKRSGTGN
ncbi:MAG: cytochrome c3 family protein [Cyanobacteria bacterium P01_E01_bin.42]